MVRTPIQERIRGKEEELLQKLGIQLNGRKHITCPFPDHDDQDPSWRWDSNKKLAYCTCQQGKPMPTLEVVMRMRGADFAAAASWCEEVLSLECESAPKVSSTRYLSSKPATLLAPPSDLEARDLARRYLASRLGIDPQEVVLPTTRVASWRAFPYYVAGATRKDSIYLGDHPMVAFELLCKDQPPLAHRVYVTSSGSGKATIVDADGKSRECKKLSTFPDGMKNRSASGYVVVFGHPGCATMIVCEGIEDAAALAYCFREEIQRGEIVVVGAVSGPALAGVEVYRGTKRLIIAAHRDEGKSPLDQSFKAGEKAAGKLLAKHRRRLDRISLALPGDGGTKTDWLDLMLGHGVSAVRSEILGSSDLGDEPEDGETVAGNAEKGADQYFTVGSDVDVAVRLVVDLRAEYSNAIVGAEGALWRYAGTHWQPIDVDELRRRVHAYDGTVFEDRLGKMKIINLSKSRIDSILHEAQVHVMQPRFFEKPAVGINVLSGFLQFNKNGEMEQVPHSPEHRCRAVQPGSYPVADFDERYAGSLLENLLTGCFLGDEDAAGKVGLIQETAGVAVAGYGTRLKDRKVLILNGPKAANGKTQIIDMITELVPETARSAVPLQKLSDEKYRVALRGSLLNAVAEISAEGFTSNEFNMVTSGDLIGARDVYSSLIQFRCQAQHLYSCNELPSFRSGVNQGVSRRLLVINFNRVIPEDEQIANIGARIVSEEYDLLLHWAVEGAKRVIPTGFYSRLQSSVDAVREWIIGHDPVAAWLAGGVTVTEDPEHVMASAEAYRYFCQWAESEAFSKSELPKKAGFTARVLANSKVTYHRKADGRYLVGLTTESRPYNPSPRPEYGDPSYPSWQRAEKQRAQTKSPPPRAAHSAPASSSSASPSSETVRAQSGAPAAARSSSPSPSETVSNEGRTPVAPDGSVVVMESPEVVDPDTGEFMGSPLTNFPGSRLQSHDDWQEPAHQSPACRGDLKPPSTAS